MTMSYRLQQGVRGLLSRFRTVDDGPAEAYLAPDASSLYARMGKTDREHCLRVFGWLQTQGDDDPDLLTAALLHDVGKSTASIGVWHRSLKVLLKRISPQSWQSLSRPADTGSPRYAFYVLDVHPRLGARMAAKANCSKTTVWLIRNHETEPDKNDPRYPLLRALQDADAVN
jgi:hypothetical protein